MVPLYPRVPEYSSLEMSYDGKWTIRFLQVADFFIRELHVESTFGTNAMFGFSVHRSNKEERYELVVDLPITSNNLSVDVVPTMGALTAASIHGHVDS